MGTLLTGGSKEKVKYAFLQVFTHFFFWLVGCVCVASPEKSKMTGCRHYEPLMCSHE